MSFDITRRLPNQTDWIVIAETDEYDLALKVADFLNKTEYGEFKASAIGFFEEEIEEMDTETVQLRDCVNMSLIAGKYAILSNGKVIGFKKEEIPTQTANPSGDNK